MNLKMHKPTKYNLATKLDQIRILLHQGEKGNGISKKMNIPLRTTERYIQRVYEQDKQKWSDIASESLENRALKIKSHYERLAKISKSILHDESKSPRDRIDAGKTMIAC